MSRIIAWNKDEKRVVLKKDNLFIVIDTLSKDVVETATTFNLTEDWQIRTGDVLPVWEELAVAATTTLSIDNKESAKNDRVFRVPKSVQAISTQFSENTTTLGNIHEFATNVKSLNESKTVQVWVSKILNTFPLDTTLKSLTASAFEYDEESDYFGEGISNDTTEVTGLYMHLPDDTWAQRVEGDWEPMEAPGPDEIIIMLDPESAESAAHWVDNPDEYDPALPLELSLLTPEEFGLFFSAEAELDFELLDRMFDIYDPQERSINAKKQVRGPGGKFTPNPGGGEGPAKPSTPKARMAVSLPLVEDVNALIESYISQVTSQRSGPVPEEGVVASFHVESFADATQAAVTDVRPLYLAIVDEIDTDAVLDVIALVPPAAGAAGDVSAWRREAGKWVSASESLAALRGSQPPSVIELKDDVVLKGVLDQVDKATTVADQPDEIAPAETEVDGSAPSTIPVEQKQAPVSAAGLQNLTARGFAFSDGTLLIRDLPELREAISIANGVDRQLHVIKRARALNRFDLIPPAWNARHSAFTNDNQMWGPYGELLSLTADGGTDRNRGNADRLRQYWTVGLGGKKVAWGLNNGSWRRCVRYLSKYLGVRSRGYCTLRFHEMTGFYPGDKENTL